MALLIGQALGDEQRAKCTLRARQVMKFLGGRHGGALGIGKRQRLNEGCRSDHAVNYTRFRFTRSFALSSDVELDEVVDLKALGHALLKS
jgi:hypothetical protein